MKTTIDIPKDQQKRVEEILRSYNALCLNAEIAKRRVNDINKAWAILTPEEQVVIHRMIIEPMNEKTIFNLCEELHRECSTIYRLRASGIKKIATALFGIAEVDYAGML